LVGFHPSLDPACKRLILALEAEPVRHVVVVLFGQIIVFLPPPDGESGFSRRAAEFLSGEPVEIPRQCRFESASRHRVFAVQMSVRD
jgi:hypothetical protein